MKQRKLRSGEKEYLYRVNTGWCDPADAALARDCLEGWGARWAGTWNKATILIRLMQHAHMDAMVEYQEGLKHLDPVTAVVLDRDVSCRGCGSLANLERHSHLKPHSKAAPKHCVLLCHDCHALYHAGGASIEWLGPGDIIYMRKDEKNHGE